MDEQKTNLNSQDNLKTIRTYMTDMADTVRANEISVIKVALAEQNKHEREDLNRKIEGTPVKKIFWLIGGVIIIAGAIYGIYFLNQQKKKIDTPAPMIKETSIISYDITTPVLITGSKILTDEINIVKKEIVANNKTGSINFISLFTETNGVKEPILVKNLFTYLGFTAPSSLVRSLSDSYMIGTYNNGSPKLFIIFQTQNYENTYAGMLDWEKTLASDMFNLFDLNTNENKLKLNEMKWKDIIINNKDARVLNNENDVPILYYLFADKNNLVIADSVDTLKEIISRLAIKNIKPL